jgi:hypothetical protein
MILVLQGSLSSIYSFIYLKPFEIKLGFEFDSAQSEPWLVCQDEPHVDRVYW